MLFRSYPHHPFPVLIHIVTADTLFLGTGNPAYLLVRAGDRLGLDGGLVLEGVRGAADTNLDRTISVREIVEYATREMPLLSRRLARDTITQQPVGYSRGADFSVAGG